jgi:hypothetical protein
MFSLFLQAEAKAKPATPQHLQVIQQSPSSSYQHASIMHLPLSIQLIDIEKYLGKGI